MDQSERRSPAIVGRVARVELCGCGNSLVLTVGPLTLRLDYLAAEDVAATLLEALARASPERLPPFDAGEPESDPSTVPDVREKKQN